MASWPLALAGGWGEAAPPAYPLPKAFPLLRGHVLPAVRHSIGHSTAKIGAIGTVASKSAEEDPAQRQNSKRLPEGNLTPSEERRQQPIPQLQHYFAAEGNKQQHRQRSQDNPFLSHFPFLMLS